MKYSYFYVIIKHKNKTFIKNKILKNTRIYVKQLKFFLITHKYKLCFTKIAILYIWNDFNWFFEKEINIINITKIIAHNSQIIVIEVVHKLLINISVNLYS